jgi:PilZ domain
MSHNPLSLKERPIPRPQRHATAYRKKLMTWHPRASGRRAVTFRVDYVTAQGKVWMGLVRNLSVQGMYIDSALRHVAHEVAPGDLLTVVFVLPSGRPCKLRALVIHCDRQGCGVQFRHEPAQALAPLAHYWASLDAEGQQ